ncbi:MAG: hypothetical protein CMG60_03035 [Candidatus Marinimicrobia bacterium]|nr:hypothetical protein [Candidatus Neomarinimicrobiota bacterium]
MTKKNLHNILNKEELKVALNKESFCRITASFYRYVKIEEPDYFRDFLYEQFNDMNILGRIYVASEGINAQISVPEFNWNKFIERLNDIEPFRNVMIKAALDNYQSFYKLIVKVRKELVAFSIPEEEYSMGKVGKHLTTKDYNRAMDDPDSIIVDMRNYYESEIGHFEHALIPNVETSKELLPEVMRLLNGKEDKKILLYCTGGIRCEKASAYLIHQGFEDVNQLQGGIIQYANDIREYGVESKFKGKNFVFDNRLGERVTDDIISDCHICGEPSDDHTDCKNDACHILFIQCEKCSTDLGGCCSRECHEFSMLPIEKQRKLRKDPNHTISKTFFDSRVKPRF